MKYANQKKIQMILLKILQNEDSYEDLDLVISMKRYFLLIIAVLPYSVPNPVLF